MKIKPRPFQIMWDTHSVCGIFLGLALFVIFYTGAFTLFYNQILVWEEPSLRPIEQPAQPIEDLAQPVLDSWGVTSPGYLYLGMPHGDHAGMYVYTANEGGPERAYVNPATGDWVDEAGGTGVSTTIYFLHFFYQLGRWGMYLAGLVGLFALLAIVSGVIIHLHRLKKDFFQFRPKKKLRVAWADAHKVLGTIGLPFQIMYVLTGTFYCLLIIVALPYTLLLFDGSATELYRAAGYSAPAVTVDSVEAAGPVSLQALLERAEGTWDGFEVSNMNLYNGGQPNARVEVFGSMHDATFGGTGILVYHGVTGEELARQDPREPGTLNLVVNAIEVLHFAEFGGVVLRWLFFFLALASCGVILTGNLAWLEVRRGQDRRINRVLARLTAGVATGTAPATALLFLSALLLPDSSDKKGLEELIFFGSWLLFTIYALARTHVARTHRSLLATGGVLALLIPVVNGVATGAWPWVTWGAGQWAVFGVDLGALVCGLVLLGLAACIKVGAAAPADAPRKPVRRPAPAPRREPSKQLA